MTNKRKYIMALAMPLLVIAGCQKSIDAPDAGQVPEGGLEVSVGDVLRNAGTKTYLTGDGEIAWSGTDTVLIIGKTKAEMKVVPLGTDATHGFLTAVTSDDMPEPAATGMKYTAYCPAGMFDQAATTAAEANGTLSPVYDFEDCLASPLGCLPMYAASNGKTLEFKTACGVLELSMKGVMTVTKVKLTCDDPISGAFKINPATGEATLTGSAADSVVINCGAGVTLGRVAGVKFYVPFCEGTYHNLKLKVFTDTDRNGGCFEHTYPEVTIKKGDLHVNEFTVDHDAVQLWPGGPYWATANIGASSPADCGDYFMWGDTQKRYTGLSGTTFTFPAGEFSTGFDWTSYSQVDGTTSGDGFTKYTLSGSVLSESDDIARALWGENWSVPTMLDYAALYENCDHSWESDYEGTGVAGMLFTSRTDDTKSVFFPAAGYGNASSLAESGTGGHYWSGTLNFGNEGSCLTFDNGGDADVYGGTLRCHGLTVRPVKGGKREAGVNGIVFEFTGDKNIKTIKYTVTTLADAPVKEGTKDYGTGLVGPAASCIIGVPAGEYKVVVEVETDAVSGGTAVNVSDWGGLYYKRLAKVTVPRNGSYTHNMHTNIWSGVLMWYPEEGEEALYWSTKNLGATNGTTYDTWYGDYYAWGACEVGYTAVNRTVSSGSTAFTFSTTPPVNDMLANKYTNWGCTSGGFVWGRQPYVNATVTGTAGTTSPGNNDATAWYKYGAVNSVLDLMDDAANHKLGGTWRMPKGGPYASHKGEYDRLWAACGNPAFADVWKSTYNPGTGSVANLAGSLLTSSITAAPKGTGKSIFFPAAGYGDALVLKEQGTTGNYCSATKSNTYSVSVYFLQVKSSGSFSAANWGHPIYGRTVRPVCTLP